MKCWNVRDQTEFSPPYGDGTKTANKTKSINLFSPPYGDGTLVYPLFP